MEKNSAFSLLLFFFILDLIYIAFCKGIFKKCQVTKRKIYFGLFLIIMFSSFPIFSYYLYQGHDLQFYLMRIQGLKEGLLSGQFPIKIQPNWQNGYGYGVSVF